MRVTLPLIHLDSLVFTPLPQLLLKQQLVLDGVCAPEEVTILEYSREDDLAATFSAIVSTNPDVVGFSSYVWNHRAVAQLSKALKDYYGDKVSIVWGGPHVSEKPRWFAQNYQGSVDFVTAWYGELSFSQLCKAILQGRADPALVPAYTAGSDGGPAKAPEFDELPLPYRKEWLPETVTRDIRHRVFLYETYRNCPFSCEYCMWGKASNKIEGISFEQVMQGFEHLLSLGMKHLKFADAGLGVVKKDNRDKRLWRTLADMDLHKRGVNLRTYFFWQVIDDEWAEIFAKLISQGVIGTMDLGIQTFNPKALTDMKRPTDYARFHRVTGILQKHRVPYAIDLILGLPGDTLDGFKHSVRKCIDYKPQRFQSFLCSVLPGAGYDLRKEELGIKTIRGSLMDDDEKVIETKTFPREDIQIALDLEAWLYLVFSLQLCPSAIRKIAEETDVNALHAVESLRSWATKNAPQLTEMVCCYRRNLYDSRQKGRVQCDEYLYSHFKDIYLELMEFAHLWDVPLEMRDDLLRFPKTRETADQLAEVEEDILCHDFADGGPHEWKISYRSPTGWVDYKWKADPIPGVVATKYAFWTWDKVEIKEEVCARA